MKKVWRWNCLNASLRWISSIGWVLRFILQVMLQSFPRLEQFSEIWRHLGRLNNSDPSWGRSIISESSCPVYIILRVNFGILLKFAMRGTLFGTNRKRQLFRRFWSSLPKLQTCITKIRQRERVSSVTLATLVWECVWSRRLMKVCGYLYHLPHVFSKLLNLIIVLMNWSC